MSELGTYYRVWLKADGGSYDFDVLEGREIIQRREKYIESNGDSRFRLYSGMTIVGTEVFCLDIESIENINLSTPETREAERERNFLFTKEQADFDNTNNWRLS